MGLAPRSSVPEHWIDPAAFFSRGTSGQWRDLLDDADLARYAARVRALASDNLVEWVHPEPIDGDPVRRYARTTQS